MTQIFVIPANAGIPLLHFSDERQRDPRVRGDDGIGDVINA